MATPNIIIAPFQSGSALTGEQGGTGLDSSKSVPGLVLVTTGNDNNPYALTAGIVPPVTPAAINNVPTWIHVGQAISFAAFAAAALTDTINLFSLPAGGIIHNTKLIHSQSFAGGAVATCTLSVGNAGNAAKYCPAFDVHQAPSATVFILSNALGTENNAAATNINITATSTGGNLNALIGGIVDVWCLLSLPS